MWYNRLNHFMRFLQSPANPIGKINDYFYRIELQQRGAPHIHALFWAENAPKLDQNTDDEICSFIDEHISCQLPDEDHEPVLHEIVSAVQVHYKRHTKS